MNAYISWKGGHGWNTATMAVAPTSAEGVGERDPKRFCGSGLINGRKSNNAVA